MDRLLRITLGTVLGATAALGIGIGTGAAAAPAASTAQSRLVGELGFEGGPYPGGFHPTAGSVEVFFTLVPLVLVKTVGPSGHFSIRLGPGSYRVTGCGPSASSTAVPLCSSPTTVTLKAGEVDHIRLVWALAP